MPGLLEIQCDKIVQPGKPFIVSHVDGKIDKN
jgi:hypothetical protein